MDGERTIEDIKKRRTDRWNFLFIAGMWFQDLYNYDFRRTEQCIIPYATQEGEISFCAYNTGVGWRNIIEKMHMTATLTKWYEEHGRHEIFAGGKAVGLNQSAHKLNLNEEHVHAGRNTTLDDLGIAKTAREEKTPRPRQQAKEVGGRCPHGSAVSRAHPERTQAGTAGRVHSSWALLLRRLPKRKPSRKRRKKFSATKLESSTTEYTEGHGGISPRCPQLLVLVLT